MITLEEARKETELLSKMSKDERLKYDLSSLEGFQWGDEDYDVFLDMKIDKLISALLRYVS